MVAAAPCAIGGPKKAALKKLSSSSVKLTDVAALAGVSASAVSRAFTQGASVSPATRQMVERAAAKLGYEPSLIARSLATNKTKLVGLVADNFRNPAFMEVFDLYTRALQARELRPLLVNLAGEADARAAIRLMRQYRIDGVIVATSTLPSAFVRGFLDAGLSVVHAFGRGGPRPPFDVVGVDNVAAGALAARTLVERGYRSVAFLGGPEKATSTIDRAKGFVAGLNAAGLAPARMTFASAYDYEAGFDAMGPLLAARGLDALFCGDDLIAMGALDALRAVGRRAPDDMGVLGFDGVDLAGWRSYALTTIRQPFADIIRTSVEAVIDAIEHPARAARTVTFPCRLVERGTLRPLNAKSR